MIAHVSFIGSWKHLRAGAVKLPSSLILASVSSGGGLRKQRKKTFNWVNPNDAGGPDTVHNRVEEKRQSDSLGCSLYIYSPSDAMSSPHPWLMCSAPACMHMGMLFFSPMTKLPSICACVCYLGWRQFPKPFIKSASNQHRLCNPGISDAGRTEWLTVGVLWIIAVPGDWKSRPSKFHPCLTFVGFFSLCLWMMHSLPEGNANRIATPQRSISTPC